MAWVERFRQKHRPTTGRDRSHRTAIGCCLGIMLSLLTLFTGITPARAADGAMAEAAGLQAGARLFEAHCMGCHINGGNVIRRGRTLKQAALEKAGLADPEAIASIAADGIGQMSGYGAVLGEEGAAQVGQWVWLQARAGWPRTPQAEPLP